MVELRSLSHGNFAVRIKSEPDFAKALSLIHRLPRRRFYSTYWRVPMIYFDDTLKQLLREGFTVEDFVTSSNQL